MDTLAERTAASWWRRLRLCLTTIYLAIALVLLLVGGTGQLRLLAEIGRVFGGFFWTVDNNGQVIVIFSSPQMSTLGAFQNSLTSTDFVAAANGQKGPAALAHLYQRAQVGQEISYVIQQGNQSVDFVLPTTAFTWDIWWQNYGLAFIAGISWLVVGVILLTTAPGWVGAVEGMTLLPPAMLFLLVSHWGNVQMPYPTDPVIQLLWIPSFALLGGSFIHLSLAYRPDAVGPLPTPRFLLDGLPYVPLIVLVTFEWGCYLISGQVPTRLNELMSLSYGAFGGAVSLGIGFISLGRVSHLLPGTHLPVHTRRQIGDLLTLWIGGVGLGFCLGVLPLLLTGKTLLPVPLFFMLAAVYPLLLLYAIRSLRLIDRLQASLQAREEALRAQEKTSEELYQANRDLRQAASLLLHADAHLRSLLSQRIHDQPKQQALRIRSFLGYWLHRLEEEAAGDPMGKVVAYPIVDALAKARTMSEELESDLRGLQLLVEDAYQRRSLGVKLHLEKLLREDLPALHPESLLTVQIDLRALDVLSHDLEESEQGRKIAEAISYTVTQAMLNIYNHAQANRASVCAVQMDGSLEVSITDDGRGFNASTISPEKTSLFKAELKTREAGGTLVLQSIASPRQLHGTTVILRMPLP